MLLLSSQSLGHKGVVGIKQGLGSKSAGVWSAASCLFQQTTAAWFLEGFWVVLHQNSFLKAGIVALGDAADWEMRDGISTATRAVTLVLGANFEVGKERLLIQSSQVVSSHSIALALWRCSSWHQ